MRDFTVKIFSDLIKALQTEGYLFFTYSEYRSLKNPGFRFVILRHDVDALPRKSLQFAQLEASLGIRGTYYFRTVPVSFDEEIISKISALGHEIGYHYETMSEVTNQQEAGSRWQLPFLIKFLWNSVSSSVVFCGNKKKTFSSEQYIDKAYGLFIENLEKMRRIVPVTTICMHGSPLSRYDNQIIWEKYDYRQLGITGEPYFDTDFSRVFYLTDTGRSWNGKRFSIRDKVGYFATERLRDRETKRRRDEVTTERLKRRGDLNVKANRRLKNEESETFRHSRDIIHALRVGTFPGQVMFTFHPQRWTNAFFPWIKELVWQNLKNGGKWMLLKVQDFTQE